MASWELAEQMPVWPVVAGAHEGRGDGGGSTESCNARLKTSYSDRHADMSSAVYRGIGGSCDISY
jgi:hypothetical protein